jgi:hypothetical protein
VVQACTVHNWRVGNETSLAPTHLCYQHIGLSEDISEQREREALYAQCGAAARMASPLDML